MRGTGRSSRAIDIAAAVLVPAAISGPRIPLPFMAGTSVGDR